MFSVFEALHPFIDTSIFYVFDNLQMVWMCIWMRPYHDTASLIDQTVLGVY